ncbi:AAA family ATPase [Citrobacter freundii]|uniref:DEAD/DEAH box helicase n=1 Tax=Citrobacter freundii TaxID=546 RepID=UPI0013CFD607|nr:AAA domain-containing protein [Citrobacter freundii]EKL0721039.1 AAA family ATPase [Citrobacter freundii]EKW2054216.1 AAA family ATPase [Citrobacter freundii]MBY5297722.1 AAA family ATPase [Citrobacter freundii]NGF05044.1 AAA family ATPase [Citrobacter freundii]HCC5908596.1 AAA family ATPase [Citrobacter freundii]
MTSETLLIQPEPTSEVACLPATMDLIDHIDDWLTYLVKLVGMTTDVKTRIKYRRQIKYLVRFRYGANCNITHNITLARYYTKWANKYEDAPGSSEKYNSDEHDSLYALARPMAFEVGKPVQSCYLSDVYAFKQVQKALACEDIFFLQGPPGTGKTTAIVEIILQTLRHKPDARILITSETHVAVDNALDRLTSHLSSGQMATLLRYPRFTVSALENPDAILVQAQSRANALWNQAHQTAPELTCHLWQRLDRGRKNEKGKHELPRWLVRNLADNHQIIGVTCNQLDHLLDKESEIFDLAIVDECSKATLPEWIMALSVAQKCILVGDHKQLPPTFCQEESEALSVLSYSQEKLIRDGVIERMFENFPESMKGTLLRQYRMLPQIGQFISENFYNKSLSHSRIKGNGLFEHFAWLTYRARNFSVPPEKGNQRKTLINQAEVTVILDKLKAMCTQIAEANLLVGSDNDAIYQRGKKLTVAVITPYRAQCQELRRAILKNDFSACLIIEVDTVDAFQGRQADVVFFSFVRTVGPATFYADDRRINVAISRARDCVYLVGNIDYIRRHNIPVLKALLKFPVLSCADVC